MTVNIYYQQGATRHHLNIQHICKIYDMFKGLMEGKKSSLENQFSCQKMCPGQSNSLRFTDLFSCKLRKLIKSMAQ